MRFRVVVKAVIVKDRKLLIVRRSCCDYVNPHRISVPAGFVNFGEKPQEAVI